MIRFKQKMIGQTSGGHHTSRSIESNRINGLIVTFEALSILIELFGVEHQCDWNPYCHWKNLTHRGHDEQVKWSEGQAGSEGGHRWLFVDGWSSPLEARESTRFAKSAGPQVSNGEQDGDIISR